jgi:SAM-dependent methyltransferase
VTSVQPIRAAAAPTNMALQTAEAWSLFWAAQGPGSRCLARSPDLYAPLDAHWHGVAAGLSPTARILDLGCGTGAVGRALLYAAPRLHVTGVDLARVSQSRQPRLELLSDVAMESLPFAPASFQAVVSQFGYEYGDPVRSAKALATVVAPGGLLSFLIHHPDGPLVAAMRRHRRAIEGLCGLRIQAAFFAGDSITLAERIAMLKRECANDQLIDDAGRGLHTHIGNPESGRLQVWRAVVDALAPELVMLDSLELCCVDERSIDNVVEPLRQAFELRPPKPLRTHRGEPIAWIVEGTRLS